jgi:myo-inositol-1(or 4)-monophosphatase
MEDLELAIACAEAGATVVRRNFSRRHSADLKGANDPVTEVDRESEAAIVSLIREHRPNDTIVAEEGSSSAGGRRRWLVDPLDGTVNFVHSIPQVSVSVALYDGEQPLAAVVVDPLREELFTAATGEGARCNGNRIEASEATDLEGTVMATGFAYDHHLYAAEYTHPLAAVLERVNGIRRFGSAALDLAWVAAGRFDGYWELGLAPWDLAAGLILVREAGGIVTDPWGRDATPETRLIVAGGPGIHELLREVIADSMPDRLRELP